MWEDPQWTYQRVSWDINFAPPYLTETEVRLKMKEIDAEARPAPAAPAIVQRAPATSVEPDASSQPYMWIQWTAAKLVRDRKMPQSQAKKEAGDLHIARI